MYQYFDETEFLTAIEDGNLSRAKQCVADSIRSNPGFDPEKGSDHSEAWRAYHVIENNCKNEISTYQLREDEIKITESNLDQCTEDMFIKKCFFFEKNFCMERFDELKLIGQHLVKQGTFTLPQEQTRPQRARLPLLLILGGVLIVLAVLAVTLLRQ